jgi:hypothetical protein
MNLKKKANLPSEFLAKVNKKVLQNISGAEIISEEEAIQKDQKKFSDELDKKGSIFPPIPIEQYKQKTKQEKDRLELKQDMTNWDQKNKKIVQKITKSIQKSKNKIGQTRDNFKSFTDFQITRNTEKDRFSQELAKKTNITKHISKTKDLLFDMSIQSKQKQNTDYFHKDVLEKPTYKVAPSIIKSQKTKDEKNLFDMTSRFTQLNTHEEKIQIKTKRTKRETLFNMDIGSLQMVLSNDSQNIVKKSIFPKKNNPYIEYVENENALQLKQYLKNRETITSKSCYQIENKIISDNIKEYQNTYATIKRSFDIVL